MNRKTDVQIYIQTCRNKDLQTYTDKLTDSSAEVKEGRQTNRQMYRKPNVKTFCASYGTCTDRQTDRLTDRTDKHKKTNRPTDR
jgi:hypothetical protein